MVFVIALFSSNYTVLSLNIHEAFDYNSIDNNKIPFDKPSVGVDGLTRISSLPLECSNSRTYQYSSRNLSGGNKDGNLGSHFYKDENGDYVIFEDYGPGCIYRMWLTGNLWRLIWKEEKSQLLSRIKIYVDDMRRPVINNHFLVFFSGLRYPFMYPITNFIFQSSGGFVSYMPISYTSHCKIVLTRKPEFFQVTYKKYDTDENIESFNKIENIRLLKNQWNKRNLGLEPKEERDTSSIKGHSDISAGENVTLWNHCGSGAIWSFYLDIKPFEQKAVENLWLRIHWDGNPNPAVNVPVNQFFGSYYIKDAPRALLVGYIDSKYYCHIPMPYWSSAKVELHNLGGTDIEVDSEIVFLEEEYPINKSGYFYSIYNNETTVVGKDYTVLDIQGAGHYIGITHTMKSSGDFRYMEGDERIHTDGSQTPFIYGTGTEDFYNGGWYFKFGTFIMPLHGATTYISNDNINFSSCYRFMLGDLIPFGKDFFFGIEHDDNNIVGGDNYQSVSYLYLYPKIESVLTDSFNIGDQDSELQHDYCTDVLSYEKNLTAFYEGDNDDVKITDNGSYIKNTCSFNMSISKDNQGVLLRRRFDQQEGRQLAKVFVDGKFAGYWYNLVSNPFKRWADSDILLPESLTSGKSEIKIRVENIGDVFWSQFDFQIFSIMST